MRIRRREAQAVYASMKTTLRSIPLLALSALAFAQKPLDPDIIFSTDSVLKRVYKFEDADGDKSFGQPGETVVLYDNALGAIPLLNPMCLTQSPDDRLYVGDAGLDRILCLDDHNEDGDAYDTGAPTPTGDEAWIFFDGHAGGNAGGIVTERITSIAVTNLGQVWVSVANDTPNGKDMILLLVDINGDGDANDAGEATVHYEIAPGAAADFSEPVAVRQGLDGRAYYLENGSGFLTGLYRLEDLDFSGSINAPGESTLFFRPLPFPVAFDFESIDQDEQGYWYVLDNGNNIVFRARDFDVNGAINSATEATTYWLLELGSNVSDIAVTLDGALFVGDDRSNDRLLRAEDASASGTIEPAGETVVSYDDTANPVNTDSFSGLTADFHGHADVGTPYCGSGSNQCPCSNDISVETGCANSTGAGARLEAEGTDSIANDDLEFLCEGLPPGKVALLFQGSNQAGGGLGIPFGDGQVCVGGSALRLGTQFADNAGLAVWTHPFLPLAGWTVGSTWNFQVRYRDPMGPCGSGFNFSNGLSITFTQ